MPIKGVTPKNYILSLFVRDDGERFVLGSGYYEFKDKQMHFKANTVANDVIEVQGNDGYLLAGQVRRPGSQDFDGYVGDGTVDKAEVEQKRRDFLAFFRKNHFYKVVYVFSDGTAIQRKRGFLVDDPTVKELYQIYPEYHVALNFEDVNYYSYAEDEDGEEIYAKIAQIQLTQRKATGGLVWDSVGVVWEEQQWGGTPASAGGSTSFTVDNQAGKGAPLASVQLNGDTYQQTYSGKNLFNKDTTDTKLINGATYSTLSTGVKVINSGGSNWGGVLFMKLNASDYVGKTLTFSANAAPSSTNVPRIAIILFNEDASTRTTVGTTGTGSGNLTASYTVDSVVTATPYIGVTLYGNFQGTLTNTLYVDYTNVQLEVGPATSYEPYTNGPAPNPDYPQDIDVVTGEQTVTVTGKNLFDKSTIAGVSSGASWNGEILTSNTFSSALPVNTIAYISPSIPLNQEYTISVDLRLTSGSTGHFQRLGDGYVTYTQIDSPTISTEWQRYSAKYTPTSAYEFKSFMIRMNSINGSIEARNFQLETGSTSTTYEPYQSTTKTIDLGSIELAKLGTYQDYIYKSGDDWYVHKATDNLTLNGSEDNWTYSSSSSMPFRIELSNAANLTTSQNIPPSVYTNYYVPVAWNASAKPYMVSSTGSKRLAFRNIDITSLDNWKTWLSNNNTTVYYPLATATDTKITDATLIEQLEELEAMRLFVGINNFLITSTSPNLPAPLDITYYTQIVSLGGAEWSEGAPTGPTTVEVDSIDTVFPVWTVKGPAVNPQLSVLTTNTTFKYNGTVSASQELVVDMMNKTVLLNGVNMIGNMEGDWASFNPGTNRVVYTTDNADAQASTIEWQEIVG